MSIKPIVGSRIAARRARAVLALSVVSWTLAACGQKGPLFLPTLPAAGQPAKNAPSTDTRNTRPAEATTPPAR